MSLQRKIAQHRIDTNQPLRFAVADIGSKLLNQDTTTFTYEWLTTNHPRVDKNVLITTLLLEGFYVENYGSYSKVHISVPVFEYNKNL